MSLKIIDISKNNTITSWDRVAAAVDGVIIRAGYRGATSGGLVEDTKFRQHITMAVQSGVKRIGVYWWSTHLTPNEAEADAKYLQKLLDPYKARLNLGVWLDSEAATAPGKHGTAFNKLTPSARSLAHRAFLAAMQAAGYKAGLYCSESWYKTHLIPTQFSPSPLWVAKYSTQVPKVGRVYVGWQHTDKGRVDGISGAVDVSRWYEDPVPAKKTPAKPLLKRGSRGAAVKELQRLLGGIAVDGIFGPKTEAAVKAYQRQYKLVIDGIVGPKTWAALLK